MADKNASKLEDEPDRRVHLWFVNISATEKGGKTKWFDD